MNFGGHADQQLKKAIICCRNFFLMHNLAMGCFSQCLVRILGKSLLANYRNQLKTLVFLGRCQCSFICSSGVKVHAFLSILARDLRLRRCAGNVGCPQMCGEKKKQNKDHLPRHANCSSINCTIVNLFIPLLSSIMCAEPNLDVIFGRKMLTVGNIVQHCLVWPCLGCQHQIKIFCSLRNIVAS